MGKNKTSNPEEFKTKSFQKITQKFQQLNLRKTKIESQNQKMEEQEGGLGGRRQQKI